MNALIIMVLVALCAFAGPPTRHAPPPDQAHTATTAPWESSYGPMIDRSQINPYRCYIGMPVPMSGSGWFEATIINDTPAPVGMVIDGNQITFWKPQMTPTQSGVAMRPLPDRLVVNNGGADEERAVLNPGEACDMVLPYTRLEGKKARWRVHMTQYLAGNPFGRYVPAGVEGNIHTVQHRSMIDVYDEWVLYFSGDRRLDNFRLSSKF